MIRALGIGTNAEIIDLFGEEPKILASFGKDTAENYQEGLLELYKKIRPGEPLAVDSAESLITSMFFDPRRYDLAKVGRCLLYTSQKKSWFKGLQAEFRKVIWPDKRELARMCIRDRGYDDMYASSKSIRATDVRVIPHAFRLRAGQPGGGDRMCEPRGVGDGYDERK